MKQTTMGALIVVVMLLTACGAQPAPTVSPAQAAPGLANPASQNCVAVGGTVSIQARGDGGQFGICLFPDNR